MEYQDIKTLKAQVEHVLAEHSSTRNDDVELVMKVCELFPERDSVRHASSIERCRRFFNNKGQYLPTIQAVAEKRKLNISEWRIAMGYAGTDHTYTPPSERKIDRI